LPADWAYSQCPNGGGPLDRSAESSSRPLDERQPVRILVVEDDPAFAELLRMQLRRLRSLDVELEVAGTLARALELTESGSFGLVLADLTLPDSKGLATAEALCRRGDQLVIVLTGDDRPEMRAGAVEAGAYDFLSKDELTSAALDRLVRLASIQAVTRRALRESDERFRQLVGMSSDWYWEQDEQLRFTRFQGHSADAWGNRPNDAVGKLRWELEGLTPVSCTWEEHRALLDARKPFRDFIYARVRDGFEARYVCAHGEPYFDRNGKFRGYRGIATDITTRQRAEDELRRFRQAMDNSADMIFIADRETMRYVDVNATACRLTGYTREELLNMRPSDILPIALDELARQYDLAIADPAAPSGINSTYRCKDGSSLPFESTRHVVRSGGRWLIVAISRDIRPRLAAEQAVRDSERRFRDTFDLAGSGIAHVGLDGRFLRVNRRLCRLLGYTAEELVGRSVKELSHKDDRDVTDAQRARLRAGDGESVSFEKRYRRKDGSTVWVDLTVAVARDPDGTPLYEISIMEDASARKANEERILHLGRMNAALGAANEAILRAASPQEVFERACAIAVEAGGFLIGTVFVLDAETRKLSRAAASGPVSALVENIVPSMD
jgi:PAS domain S-box-containing protein